jgi:hypothetical protein
MSRSIQRERARLFSTFRELCLLSLAAPLVVVACDETLAAVPVDAAAFGPDATTGASPDADPSDAGADGALDPCAPVPYEPDAGPDGAIDFCADLVRLPCGLPADVVPRDQCFLTLNDCDRFCMGAYFNCHGWDDSCFDGSIPDGGPVTLDCAICLSGPGRRPRGLVPAAGADASEPGAPPRPRDPIGDVFADMAHLEAASVHAFRALRRDLHAFGAPRAMQRAAARAMRDEARHARIMQRLARAHRGKAVPKVRVRATPRPSLEDFARENAVEGCVHETYAALLATWPANHAEDPRIARAMQRIARDETDHAALSWAVAGFAEPRLTPEARARVRLAVERALAELEEGGAVRAPLPAAAGLPRLEEQRRLARELRARLWPAITLSRPRPSDARNARRV